MIFPNKPKITRIKKTVLVVGMLCFVTVIVTIILFCSPKEHSSEETLETDPQESAAWLHSNNNNIPVKQDPPSSTVNDNLTINDDQQAKLATALAELEIERKNKASTDEVPKVSTAYGSPIAVNLTHESSDLSNLPLGTVISTVLLTELTSNLPGESLAQVLRPVYDASQRHILIPQGTKILLKYDSASLSENRIQLQVTNLIFPSGLSQIIEGMVTLDLKGSVGLHDQVNHHYVRNFLSMVIPDLASAAQSAGQTQDYNIGALASEFAAYHSPQSQQPTIQIRKGYQFNLLVTKPLMIKNF